MTGWVNCLSWPLRVALRQSLWAGTTGTFYTVSKRSALNLHHQPAIDPFDFPAASSWLSFVVSSLKRLLLHTRYLLYFDHETSNTSKEIQQRQNHMGSYFVFALIVSGTGTVKLRFLVVSLVETQRPVFIFLLSVSSWHFALVCVCVFCIWSKERFSFEWHFSRQCAPMFSNRKNWIISHTN